MAAAFRNHLITTVEQLETVFPEPPIGNAITKEIDHVNATYRALIEAAPFFALATCGPDGLDCSPRGDPAGFVRVADEKTLLIPDRRGNNRIDSLRNIMSDPRVALMFMIPGCGEVIRVIGEAAVSTDPELCAQFVMNGKAPKVVLVVTVEKVYYQCPKALVRSKLWDPTTWRDRKSLPTPGKIIQEIVGSNYDAEKHDRE
jgi:PPOX class probable FMN-dependent enzyme